MIPKLLKKRDSYQKQLEKSEFGTNTIKQINNFLNVY